MIKGLDLERDAALRANCKSDILLSFVRNVILTSSGIIIQETHMYLRYNNRRDSFGKN